MSLLLLFNGANGSLGAPQSTDFPDLVVQIGFDAGPSTALGSTLWYDVSHLVRAVTTNRGRSAETDDFQAGTCSVTLANADRLFDPEYTAGAYYGRLLPQRRIRVLANFAGITYPVFNGFTPDDWPQDYDPPNDSHVTLDCVDGIGVLAAAPTPGSVLQWEQLQDSPKVQLSLADGSVPVTAIDLSGNGYDGTYAGVVSSASALTYGGDGAATFAAGSAVDLPSAAGLTTVFGAGGGSVSVELVMSSTSSQVYAFLYFQQDAGNTFSVVLEWSASAFQPQWTVVDHGTDLAPVRSTVAVNDGLPHHIVGVYTATGAVSAGDLSRIYVDGVAYSTAAASYGASQAQGVTLAACLDRSAASASTFIGTMDDVATYQSALSATRIAAHYAAFSAPWNGDKSGTRVGKLLDVAGWPTADRTIATGQSTLQSCALSGNVLGPIKIAEASEQGRFFISADGLATFQDRYVSLGGLTSNTTSTTSQATFGEIGSSSELPYFYQGFRSRQSIIRNIVTGQRENGPIITVKDETSRGQYNDRKWSVGTLANQNDNEVRSLLEYQADRYSQPVFRVDSITIKPQSSPGSGATWTQADLWAAVLGMEISKRYTLKRRPQNIGTAISQQVLLEGVGHQITPRSWTTTPYFSAADTRSYWVLGTSALGTDTRLAP